VANAAQAQAHFGEDIGAMMALIDRDAAHRELPLSDLRLAAGETS